MEDFTSGTRKSRAMSHSKPFLPPFLRVIYEEAQISFDWLCIFHREGSGEEAFAMQTSPPVTVDLTHAKKLKPKQEWLITWKLIFCPRRKGDTSFKWLAVLTQKCFLASNTYVKTDSMPLQNSMFEPTQNHFTHNTWHLLWVTMGTSPRTYNKTHFNGLSHLVMQYSSSPGMPR